MRRIHFCHYGIPEQVLSFNFYWYENPIVQKITITFTCEPINFLYYSVAICIQWNLWLIHCARDQERERDREQNLEQRVSILCLQLYTLHRDRDRNKEPLFPIVPVPFPVPVPVPCSMYEPLVLVLFAPHTCEKKGQKICQPECLDNAYVLADQNQQN